MKIFLLLLLSVSTIAFSQNLNFGLQAYYPFTGSANDISGYNNNPNFNNATLTTDRLGTPNSAYHFNGIDNYMQIPNSSNLNPGTLISICAWVRPTGFYMGTCHGNSILMKGNPNPSGSDSYLLRFDDEFYTNYNNCANPIVDQAHQNFYGPYPIAVTPYTPYIQLGQWYSLVYTYDGSTIKYYENCVLKKTISSSAYNFINSFDLLFGKTGNLSYNGWLNGDLDEVRIYNRILTQNEVNLYGECALAPVKLTAFNATVIENKQIKLSWNTEEESGIKNYTVERSVSGNGDYSAIGTVAAKNSSTPTAYSFTDNTFKPNIVYYYRLSINENDGSKKYSEIKTVKVNRNEFYAFIYPNPVSDVANLFLKNNPAASHIIVYNIAGQIVLNTQSPANHSNAVLLDLANYPSGSYFVSVQNGSNKSVQKVFKK